MNKKQSMTLDELLDAVVLEESEPTHERLVKWCTLYPVFRDELVEFFATWAVQKEAREEVVIDADRVGSRMVSHALDMLYREDAEGHAKVPVVSEGRLRDAIVSRGLSETEFGLLEDLPPTDDIAVSELLPLAVRGLERAAAACRRVAEAAADGHIDPADRNLVIEFEQFAAAAAGNLEAVRVAMRRMAARRPCMEAR